MIDKGVCDKGYAWNPSNCECEFDKACDFSEYLDYENCKCRMVDKLVEECYEIVEETSLVKINSANCKHNSCILFIALFFIFSEYLDYENCKCRMVDKLVEECYEIVEETSLVKINSANCKHNSCILFIALFSIFFTINIGIVTYFFYYKYMNHNKENVSKYDYINKGKNY